jgi:hypothetical protein
MSIVICITIDRTADLNCIFTIFQRCVVNQVLKDSWRRDSWRRDSSRLGPSKKLELF